MKEVRKGLFIGNISDASEVLSGDHQHQITHVLSLILGSSTSTYSAVPPPARGNQAMASVSSTEILLPTVHATGAMTSFGLAEALVSSMCKRRGVELSLAGTNTSIIRLSVPWKDTEDENIMDDLELCVGFIEQGRKNSAVLVHCLAGVSRSVAAMTAYLMKSEQLTLENALASLQGVSPSACPNPGFLGQLKLFENMGFKVDQSTSIYKSFYVERLGEAYDKGEKLENSCFARDPAVLSDSHSPLSQMQKRLEEGPTLLYRCKKCRRLLASKENVLGHMQGSKGKPFKRNSKEDGCMWNEGKESECTSVFVEPMQWMTDVQEGGVLGKLSCVGCEARLGNFNWAGQRCSCGAWVSPAFQLHKSRIDASPL